MFYPPQLAIATTSRPEHTQSLLCVLKVYRRVKSFPRVCWISGYLCFKRNELPPANIILRISFFFHRPEHSIVATGPEFPVSDKGGQYVVSVRCDLVNMILFFYIVNFVTKGSSVTAPV